MRARLSITQAAFYLGMRERAIVNLSSAGKLPHRKIGKEYSFDRDELDAWWDAQPGHKLPAHLTDTQPVAKGSKTAPDAPVHPPFKLTRGPRTHVSAASGENSSR